MMEQKLKAEYFLVKDGEKFYDRIRKRLNESDKCSIHGRKGELYLLNDGLTIYLDLENKLVSVRGIKNVNVKYLIKILGRRNNG